jgi:predicted O-methyltransferase YrrM
MASSLAYWVLHLAGLRPAASQVSAGERACLARHAAGCRSLVELGVMHGATTRLLCEVMAADGVVTAVDPFPPGRLGVSFELAIASREVSRARRGQVRFDRRRSHEAVEHWNEPIDFLVIDADHSWHGIERDWRGWTAFVAPGGIVALHDSRAVPGRPAYDSARFTTDVVLHDDRFSFIEAVDTLTVVRRVAPAAGVAPGSASAADRSARVTVA